MPNDSERRQSAGNALLGCAIGDCLGVPFENRAPPPSSWTAGDFAYESTRWTDDTQQSLVLLDDVLRHGRLDPVRVMDRFVEMRDVDSDGRFGLHRGTGRGFRHAVDAYARHGQFSPMAGRCGNGAAMRVVAAAVALGDGDASRAQLRAVASATHADDISLDAAGAVAEATWALARGRRGDEVIDDVVERLDAGAVKATLRDALRSSDPFAVIAEAGSQAAGVTLQGGAGDGYALCSPLSAVFVAVRSPSLHQVLREAVLLGGDTDSTAAMAGALRASVDGVESLPAALLAFPGSATLRRWGGAALPTHAEWLELETSLMRHRR